MSLSITYQHTHCSLHGAQIMVDRDCFMIMGKVTFDSSYLSGGEALDLSAYFPNEVLLVLIDPAHYAGSGTNEDTAYLVKYDYNSTVASAKLVVLGGGADSGGTFDEVDPTTDISNYKARFIAVGY